MEQAVGERGVGSGPQRKVPIGPGRRRRSARIDDDDGAAARALRLEAYCISGGSVSDDVGAGQQDRRRLRDVLQRKRQPAIEHRAPCVAAAAPDDMQKRPL